MKNKMEMIQQSIKEAKLFAKQHNVKLHIYEENLIDDAHLCAKDYSNDTELMTMQYKGYLVNVYIGNYQSFDEINNKWIDYDIYTDISCEERINDGYDIRGQNVLVAITDIQFYIDKIERHLGSVTLNQDEFKYCVHWMTTNHGGNGVHYSYADTVEEAIKECKQEYMYNHYTGEIIRPDFKITDIWHFVQSGE